MSIFRGSSLIITENRLLSFIYAFKDRIYGKSAFLSEYQFNFRVYTIIRCLLICVRIN